MSIIVLFNVAEQRVRVVLAHERHRNQFDLNWARSAKLTATRFHLCSAMLDRYGVRTIKPSWRGSSKALKTALRDFTASTAQPPVPSFIPAALPFESSGLDVMLRKHFQMI